MFNGATAFAQELCTDAWVDSKASKDLMFERSPGSIPSMDYTATTIPPSFSPQSREELKGAVDTHIELSNERDDRMHGSESTIPAEGSDQGTFVCKPTVCMWINGVTR